MVGDWGWAVGGWWRLVAVGGGWWLVSVGGGWQQLAVGGGWQLAVGSWRWLAVGGWWALEAGSCQITTTMEWGPAIDSAGRSTCTTPWHVDGGYPTPHTVRGVWILPAAPTIGLCLPRAPLVGGWTWGIGLRPTADIRGVLPGMRTCSPFDSSTCGWRGGGGPAGLEVEGAGSKDVRGVGSLWRGVGGGGAKWVVGDRQHAVTFQLNPTPPPPISEARYLRGLRITPT